MILNGHTRGTGREMQLRRGKLLTAVPVGKFIPLPTLPLCVPEHFEDKAIKGAPFAISFYSFNLLRVRILLELQQRWGRSVNIQNSSQRIPATSNQSSFL